MEEAGATLLKHYRDHAIMGIFLVVKNLFKILRNFRQVTTDIRQFNPDVLILIDYSGFNLRVARKVKTFGIKIFYYISPQVWAWRKHRVHDIKKVVDKMYCVLPFVKDFYAQYDIKANYVGHPLLDAIEDFKQHYKDPISKFYKDHGLDEKPIIALLPGSRKQEIRIQLPVMLEAASHFKGCQLVIAGAPSFDLFFYKELIKAYSVTIIFNQTYPLLTVARAAVVTSGTATLEAALFQVPEIVCYRADAISAWIVKQLVDVKYISLVNLIMDKEIVKELIQKNMTAANITQELHLILENEDYRDQMLEKMKELTAKLGGPGASGRAARDMISRLKS